MKADGAQQLKFSDELAQSTEASLTDDASMKVLNDINPLAGHIQGLFEEAKRARMSHEKIWLRSWANYRGRMDGRTAFISSEKSKAFIKITKTKTLAGYQQLLDVVFNNDHIPIEITASPDPMGAPEYAHIDPEDPIVTPDQINTQAPGTAVLGYPGDGNDLKPGETITDRLMSWVKDRVGTLTKVKAGPGDNPNRIILKPAEEAALFANKRVHDQLEEMDAITVFRQGAFELPLFGTGILKGPFSVVKELPNWDEQGTYMPVTKVCPVLHQRSIWSIYPEPDRPANKVTWIIERHKLNESEMLALKKRPGFRPSTIDKVLTYNPNYVNEYFEDAISEVANHPTGTCYEVLEFWGPVSKNLVDKLGADLGFKWPEGVDELQVNVWVCAGEWLRLVVNPFIPARLPYYPCPWEYNPYSYFGVGIPENMEDTQELMNGFVRLAVDNAVLSGSIMLEVDESLLSPGQDYAVETGKIFRRNIPGTQAAIRPIQINNTSQANMQMFDMARRLADEAVGIPSFSHGMTGVQGTGRTAGGISMLLGAASQAIKSVVKNCDDFWFKPIGKGIYYWNMQNDFDKRMLGDITVVAKGSASLMQKEIKSQRLLQYGQIVGAIPMASAWVNWKQWNKELGDAMEVDTKTLLNRPEEYKLALQMQMMMGQQGGGGMGTPAGEQSAVSAPGGQPMGAPATPGQQGFSGTPQAQGGDVSGNSDVGATT